MLRRVCPAVLAVLATLASADLSAQVPSAQHGLRIVVVEGEEAVNIIQQKTATAPVVEVRDRNNQPVAGAVVRFAVTRGRASFEGARTLSVITNAAGRATASGLTPTGAGAVQITASATVQGQTVAATIAQTNVMTLAEASAATSAAGSSAGAGGTSTGAGGAAGSAGGGTGGLSTTTLGIVGGAAAGGAVAVQQVIASESSSPEYVGPMQGQVVFTSTARSGGNFCTSTYVFDFMLTIRVDATNPSIDGIATARGPKTYTASTCGGGLQGVSSGNVPNGGFQAPLSGTASNVTFQVVQTGTGGNPGNPGTYRTTFSFVGTLVGDTLSGIVSYVDTADSLNQIGFAQQDFPVTLQKRQ